MTFIDLKKRLAARRDATPPTPVPPGEPVAAEAVHEEPATVAPPVAWDPVVMGAIAESLPRGQDVLLAGLGPWGRGGTRGLPETLLGRARALVAVDADKARLTTARGYCQRTLEADPADPELARRLGGQRFGVVIATDLVTTLEDPLAYLRSLRALVAPGGRLLVVVPNMGHADRRLALLAGDLPREFEPGGVRHHYTRQRLRELLAFAGFGLEMVTPVKQPILGPASELVPELFPPAVMAALGPADDVEAGFYVAHAVARPADVLLRELFDESEQLRKAVRNELAVAAHAAEELKKQMAGVLAEHAAVQAELDEARRKQAGLEELAARAEQNVRRLGKEVDDAQRELAEIKATWWFKLGQFFGRVGSSRPVEFASSGPEAWKWDAEPKGRYLA